LSVSNINDISTSFIDLVKNLTSDAQLQLNTINTELNKLVFLNQREVYESVVSSSFNGNTQTSFFCNINFGDDNFNIVQASGLPNKLTEGALYMLSGHSEVGNLISCSQHYYQVRIWGYLPSGVA
jgi:hypothetical protein